MLNLSDFKNALRCCNRSLDIYNTLLSSFTEEGKLVDHALITDCLQRLGDHALMTGKLGPALERHRSARDMRRRVLIDPNSDSDGFHSIVSVSDRRIGYTYLALGNNDMAEAHFGEREDIDCSVLVERNPPKRMRKLLISHPLKRSIHSDPVKLQYLLNQYDTAMADEKARDYEQYAYHLGAASTFQRVGDVALLLATTGSEEERQRLLNKAEDRYNLCLRIRNGKDGCSPSSPAIAATQDCLGKLFYHKGDISQARKHFEEAHKVRVGEEGIYCDYAAHHPDVVASYVYLGAIDLTEGRRIEGLDYLNKALDIYCKTFPNDAAIAMSGAAEIDHPLVADLKKWIVKYESLDLLDPVRVRDVVTMLLTIPNPAVLLI
jgi:tetratricopeptide (TPR) repeat protein